MSVDGLISLGTSVVEGINGDGGLARLLGGIAVEMTSAPRPAALARTIEDVDVLCRRRDRKLAEGALDRLGLVPDRQVNASHGSQRQVWWTADGHAHVDVFLGAFRMCHVLELDERLAVPGVGPALNRADLLLTKLQIVELTEKDVRDLGALLATAEPDTARIADACASDWGLFTTVDDNLAAIGEFVGRLDPGLEPTVTGHAAMLREAMAAAPKSRGWRMRARVGRRMRWYEEPEEVIE